MILKKIGVGSAARVAGALYGTLGLFIGAIVAFAALLGVGFAQSLGGEEAPPAFLGIFLGVGAVIFLPIFYGLFGAAMAAFMAWVYNTLARLTGGLELHLE